MNYNIKLTDKFFSQADDLENTLETIGAKITAGVYQKGTNYIEDNAGRKKTHYLPKVGSYGALQDINKYIKSGWKTEYIGDLQ